MEIKGKKCKNVKVKKMKNKCDAIGDGKGKVKQSDCEANDKCEIKKGKCMNAKPAKIKKMKNKCDALVGDDKGKVDKSECEENVACVVNGKKCENVPWIRAEFRWTAYDDLTAAQVDLATELDYTEENWNIMGTNEIEFLAFDDLDSCFEPGSQEVAVELGFDVETWDCDVNHYFGYYWEGLETYDLQKYWIELGWSAASWNAVIDPPDTNDMNWEELTEAQQKAAEEICYFQQTWDYIAIPDWD